MEGTEMGLERWKEIAYTFIIPARTAPPRYTICFLLGGSSIRKRNFCCRKDIKQKIKIENFNENQATHEERICL